MLAGHQALRILIVEALRQRGPYAVAAALFNAGYRGSDLVWR